jgi:outer membrane protein
MKKLIIAAVFAMATLGAQAQMKIGYVNSQELVSIMPETQKADNELVSYAKTFEEQAKKMQTELETKYSALEKEFATLNDAMKEVKQKELGSLQERLQSYGKTAEEKIGKKKEELYMPILEKADKAIKSVAAANGYTHVFDSSAGGILVMPEGDNLIGLLKKSMNISDTPVATAPKPGGAPKPTTPKR